MSVELVNLNPTQKALCEAKHLVVQKAEGGQVVVIDRDPDLRAKKRKLPRVAGDNVNDLIFMALRAQRTRRGEPEPTPAMATEKAQRAENAAEDAEDAAAVAVSAPAPIHRAIVEDIEPACELSGVTLDETVPTKRRASKKNKPERKHQDNRLARAFRAIIENPTATVREQASIAGVTEPMLAYYEIQLRSIYRIIYEKHGEAVIPNLPVLNR